jgi:hypothetical protein
VTDVPARAKADALDIVREITRRAGHEIRNALSGVAVNVEVVRSRVARSQGEAESRKGNAREVVAFAERAGAEIGQAIALTNGLLALLRSLLAAEAGGTLRAGSGGSGETQLELMIYGDQATVFVSDIKHLAERIGVVVEQGAERVILTVTTEGKSHSKD